MWIAAVVVFVLGAVAANIWGPDAFGYVAIGAVVLAFAYPLVALVLGGKSKRDIAPAMPKIDVEALGKTELAQQLKAELKTAIQHSAAVGAKSGTDSRPAQLREKTMPLLTYLDELRAELKKVVSGSDSYVRAFAEVSGFDADETGYVFGRDMPLVKLRDELTEPTSRIIFEIRPDVYFVRASEQNRNSTANYGSADIEQIKKEMRAALVRWIASIKKKQEATAFY